MFSAGAGVFFPEPEFFLPEPEPEVKNPEFAQHYYENVLSRSNYKIKLEYFDKQKRSTQNSNPKRKRNIVWFNPPYGKNVRTNVAHKFLAPIDKHLPKSSVLHKIFNRNSVKVSYSCIPNAKNNISNHNRRVLNNKMTSINKKTCNCRTRVSRAIGMIRRAKPYVKIDTLKLMYQSLVLPYFDYCSLVWANCSQTLKNKVQRLQNRAARVITGDSCDIRSKDILNKLGWKNLEERRISQTEAYVTKALQGKCPENINTVFTPGLQM